MGLFFLWHLLAKNQYPYCLMEQWAYLKILVLNSRLCSNAPARAKSVLPVPAIPWSVTNFTSGLKVHARQILVRHFWA